MKPKLKFRVTFNVPFLNFQTFFNPKLTLLALFAVSVLLTAASAKPRIVAPQNEEKESIVISAETETEGDVFTYNKNVVVKGTCKKGVMTFGGDVTVEGRGRVEGDVATFGGSVRQKENSHIGGDVIVFGGGYHHGKTAPERNPESQTVIYAGYEEELRQIAHDPTILVAPQMNAGYVAQRILAALFWFVLALVITNVSPGAVSRAITRLNLSNLRVAIVGAAAMLSGTIGIGLGLKFLPAPFSLAIGLMTLAFLMLAYTFGYVTIQTATGKYLRKCFFGENNRSEAIALLLGAVFWTFLLSLPYIWAAVVVGLLVVSLGLVLTAKPSIGWRVEAR